MRAKSFIRAVLLLSILLIAGLLQAGCKKDMKIILFTDTDNGFVQEALESMNYSYVPCYSMLDFYLKFTKDAWDLAIIDNRQPSPFPGAEEQVFEVLYYFAVLGGKVLINTMYLPDPDLALVWSYFGYDYVSSKTVPLNVYRIDPTSKFWTEPEEAPNMDFTGVTDFYGSAPNVFQGAALGSGIKMASFNQTVPSDPNSGAVFKANAGRTILNAFFLDDAVRAGVPIDSDSDGTADAVEWYMNELLVLEQAEGNRVQPEISPST